MATKTTGAELKKFYNDHTYWPNDDGDTWHEEEIITINGEEQEDEVDFNTIRDDAVIKIEGGVIHSPKWEEGNNPSFEGYFRMWRKQQNVTFFLVECDLSKLDEVKAAIKSAGGRLAVRDEDVLNHHTNNKQVKI